MLAVAFAIALGLAPLHEDSISSSQVRIDAQRVTVSLHFQALSMEEVLTADANQDGQLSAEEVDAKGEEIAAYLLEHFLLQQGPAPDVALQGECLSLALDPGTIDLDLSDQWLVGELSFPLAAAREELSFDVSLFLASSPGHKDFCQVTHPSGQELTWIFSRADPRWTLHLEEPSKGAGFGAWVELGFLHLLQGPDHILFVLGLLFAAASLRGLLATITAFTLAHSASLIASTMGWLVVPIGLVEPLIAASVIFVGVQNLRAKGPRRTWPEAFGFGLIHGLGFATLLAQNLAGQTSRTLPLIGFNLGIEAGQVLVALAPIVLFLWVRHGQRASVETRLTPRPVAQVGSLGITIAGLVWLVTRLAA